MKNTIEIEARNLIEKTIAKISESFKFKVTIHDEMFGNMAGTFTAQDKEDAINQAKDFYAHELDTTEDVIEVVSYEQI